MYTNSRADGDSTNIYGNVYGNIHFPSRTGGPISPASIASQTNEHSRAVNNSQGNVTTAGTVADFVTRPMSYILGRRSAVRNLQEKLGEWAGEAVNANGVWLQPVLRTTAFENHLVAHNGHFEPSGSCESTFGWAQLLYALDIRPSRGVLAWRVPTDGTDPATSGQMSLYVDGQAFCHIINLYRTYREAAPCVFTEGNTKRTCRLPFGTLSVVQETDLTFEVVFQPGTLEELATPRIPFSLGWMLGGPGGDRLRFEPEIVVFRYFNAIHYGVSNTKACLPDPEDPTCSLQKRTQALLQSIHLLPSKIDMFENRDLEPYLLTSSWVEEASRIKRRVTTDGGKDESLIDDIIDALAQRPDVLKELEVIDVQWQKTMRNILKGKCMWAEDRFRHTWTARTRSHTQTISTLTNIIRQELPTILADFASKPVGTWRHALSDMVPDVVALLDVRSNWINDPGVVLELTHESNMWKADYQICN